MTPAQQVRSLLDWYARHARSLPWRDDPTPYHVLLSELMCQQTRVATALPYYEAFTARWPTLADLAAADLDEVLGAWAGLGYYRRARALHACARAAVEAGGLPADVQALRALPGIGPYTAGAIASIAHGVPAAAVDGNVERVMSRVHTSPEAPWSAAGKRALAAAVTELHEALPDGAHPGDLTQALMELGATLCSPTQPRCEACPLRPGCRAHAQDTVDAWPRKRPRKRPTPIAAVAGVGRLNGQPLLARRAGRGLLGGLWEPVRAPLGADTDPAVALGQAFEAVGLIAVPRRPLGEVSHTFSHRQLTLTVWSVHLQGTPQPGGPYDRVQAVDPESVGLSKLARKALELDRAPPLFLAAET